MLSIRELTAGYNSNNALLGVTLDVLPGKITTVIGNNGAGKTTLLRAISGLIKTRSGEARLDDQVISNLNPSDIVSVGVSHVPEGRELFPRMSVYDNLILGAFLRKDRSIAPDLEKVYGYFPVLKTKSNVVARSLSGGEQQMLAFGRALMSKPKVLLLDEPSVGLAPLVEQHLIATVQALAKQENLAVLLVEQNANLALAVSEDAYVIELGKVIISGKADDIKNSPVVRSTYLGL